MKINYVEFIQIYLWARWHQGGVGGRVGGRLTGDGDGDGNGRWPNSTGQWGGGRQRREYLTYSQERRDITLGGRRMTDDGRAATDGSAKVVRATNGIRTERDFGQRPL